MYLLANFVMVLLATCHVAVSQKLDNLVVEERINQLETKIMTNIKQEMAQLEERLISKISPLEKQETKNQVNIILTFGTTFSLNVHFLQI